MLRKIAPVLILLLSPILLQAHGSHGNGVLAGFTHPIFGIDHAVAILAVGILGYILDSSSWYYLLLAFVVAMVTAGKFGIDNEATFFIEKVIAFSVLALGITIALDLKINLIAAMVILAIFGAFHGYAHGAETVSYTHLTLPTICSV